MIQDVQDYWNNRPCNVRHSSVDIDRNPLLYSLEVSSRKYLVEPHIPGFAQFNRWRGKKVLEIGCGIGTDTLSFAAHGAEITAVDISERSIEIAEKRARALGLQDRIAFRMKNAERWLGPGLLYDLVYSFGVLHHTPDSKAALFLARRAIKDDGELRIMVYNKCSWKAFSILVKYGKLQVWKWKELIAQYSEAQTGCPITRTYTKREIRKLLQDCGFEVVSMEVDHIFPYRIPDYIKHRYVIEWWWKILPQKLFQWLEKRIGWHLLVVARPRRG